MSSIKIQAGCLPVRGQYPALEVLLITSRYTGEWIAPKGSIERGESPEVAALRETEEEAGVTGKIGRRLGSFDYPRGHQIGRIEVFLLEVTAEWKQWPEMSIRRRKWFKLEDALITVQRAEVREMLGALA